MGFDAQAIIQLFKYFLKVFPENETGNPHFIGHIRIFFKSEMQYYEDKMKFSFADFEYFGMIRGRIARRQEPAPGGNFPPFLLQPRFLAVS